MGQREGKDYYRILQVPRTESQQGIQDAFRKLALRHHPDHAGSQETPIFREILEAYQILSDSEARRRYDTELEIEEQGGPADTMPVVIRRGPLRAHPFVSTFASPEPLVPEHHAEDLIPESCDTDPGVLFQRRSPEVLDPEVFLSRIDTVGLRRFPVVYRCPFCEISGKDWLPCIFCG